MFHGIRGTRGQLVSDEPKMSWASFANTLPEPPPKEHTHRQEAPISSVDPALLAEHPWLLPGISIAQQPPQSSAGARADRQHDRRVIPDDADVDALEQAWQDFHQQQQDWLAAGGSCVNFQTFLRSLDKTNHGRGGRLHCLQSCFFDRASIH